MILTQYESWGRYPKNYPEKVINLFWRHEIPDLNSYKKPVLAYAYGKSYGDICQNGGGILLDTKGLSRIISWDANGGILRCESGLMMCMERIIIGAVHSAAM